MIACNLRTLVKVEIFMTVHWEYLKSTCTGQKKSLSYQTVDTLTKLLLLATHIINKNGFQSKNPSPACRQKVKHLLFDLGMSLILVWSSPQTSRTKLNWCLVAKLAFSIRWPCPWPNDLDIQTWPRYCHDVPPHHRWSFYVTRFKSYSPNRQADRQADRQTLPLPHMREVK